VVGASPSIRSAFHRPPSCSTNGMLLQHWVGNLNANISSHTQTPWFSFRREFQPPGASFAAPGESALREWRKEHDNLHDPAMIALREAQQRAAAAEKKAKAALETAGELPSLTCSKSILFVVRTSFLSGRSTLVPKPKGPECSICKSSVDKTNNPWQMTKKYGPIRSFENETHSHSLIWL
jgi:hypothetical protein